MHANNRAAGYVKHKVKKRKKEKEKEKQTMDTLTALSQQ